MDPRRTRLSTAAASLMLAAVTAAGAAQAQQEGWLLAGIRRTIPNPHMAELIDLRSGARRALPMSPSSLSGGVNVDIWWSSQASARTLLRTDDRGNADVFDSDTLRLLDSFSLASLPGTRRPIFLGTPRLSPDGQYVLAYWIRDVRSMNSELTIFDRKGRELRQVSSSPENDRNWVGAFAWAPRKGRYVFLDDEGIHVCQLDSASCLTAPLRLPPGVGAHGALLDVSPDGRRLALMLAQFWPDSSGHRASHSVLFAANLDGTNLRQLTAPSKVLQDSATDIAPLNPRWSPDSRRIAFTPRGANLGLAFQFHQPCAAVRVVDAAGGVHELGVAAAPSQDVLKADGAPVTICSFMQWVP
jgi:hypothetical protein